MRQLTYYIPIERMSRTAQIEAIITKAATAVNGSCLITYETLTTSAKIFSTMVVTLFTKPNQCDHIHRTMQQAMALALRLYSSDTYTVRVTDIPVAMRDFNVKDIL